MWLSEAVQAADCVQSTEGSWHGQEGPLLVVKPRKSGAKRTMPLEGRLSGRQQKSEATPLNSRL